MPPTVYATQRPSGEKDAAGRNIDFTSPNGTALLSCGPSVHSVFDGPFVTAKMSVPSGDHDSGTCAVSLSAFVSREGVPLPSARCEKMPRSPSRSDWNATRWASGDQTGNRFWPPLVSLRTDVA